MTKYMSTKSRGVISPEKECLRDAPQHRTGLVIHAIRVIEVIKVINVIIVIFVSANLGELTQIGFKYKLP